MQADPLTSEIPDATPPAVTSADEGELHPRALGIKAGLLLGFGTLAAVGVLITVVAFYALTRVGHSIQGIVGSRLPVALETQNLGRRVDALIAMADPLVSAPSEAARDRQRKRIDAGVSDMQDTLDRLRDLGAGLAVIRIQPVVELLAGNLRRLDGLVRERTALGERKEGARTALMNNLQTFQGQLVYRFRMLEGDAAVLQRQFNDNIPLTPPLRRQILSVATLVPAAKLYADIEAINGRLLVAGEAPTGVDVGVAQAAIALKMIDIEHTLQRLEQPLTDAIAAPFAELRRLATADTGLPSLRLRELEIIADTRHLMDENALISDNIGRAVDSLVAESRDGVQRAAATAGEVRTSSMVTLGAVVVVMLIGVGVLMRFYVIGHLIDRLSLISEAMRQVAGGHYNLPLPPEGTDELGQLGRALRKFRDTSISAEAREKELRSANLKARQALNALETAQQDLLRQARTDFLTGIANRQHFLETAGRLWERSQRDGKPVALLMIDIDHFKHINDTYGHQTGDLALQHFVTVCSNTLRPTDILGRLGGEEFAALLPGASGLGLSEAAERLREAIAQASLDLDGRHLKMTISIGISGVRGADDTLEAALARADAALYAAKLGGRNRVVA